MDTIRILAIPGSLRAASLHLKLVNSLQALAPDNVEITVFRLNDIPVFNQDLESDGIPASVQALRDAIAASDAVIFATPEYNGAMTGVIKNAIDWASRKKLLRNRIATIISGSTGSLGATKAQESLRAVLTHMGMFVLPRPSLAIPKMDEKLSDDGISDERTAKFVADWLATFSDFVIQLNK